MTSEEELAQFEPAGLVALLRVARAEHAELDAKVRERLLEVTRARLEEAQRGGPPLKHRNEAWWAAHEDRLVWQLSSQRLEAGHQVMRIERALVEACLRTLP